MQKLRGEIKDLVAMLNSVERKQIQKIHLVASPGPSNVCNNVPWKATEKFVSLFNMFAVISWHKGT